MDQASGTHLKGGTAFYQPEWRQLHTEPHIRPTDCHITSLPWQELEEELNKFILTRISDRDQDINGT